MSTYLKTYCTIDDIQLVAPCVFDYDRKRRVTSWVSHSGSGSSEVFVAGSVGKFDQLFENDIEQTSVSSVGDVNADGKFFFDEDADAVYYRPTGANNPSYDLTITIGRDNKTLFNEFISRSSDFIRSYINKPIYENVGVGEGDSLGRTFPEVIVRSCALLSASMAVMPYDAEEGLRIQALAYDTENETGLLDLIRRGVISLDQDETARDKILKEVSVNGSSTGSIVDLLGTPSTNYDKIKVIITSGGTFAPGSASAVTYSTFVGNDTGLKIDASEENRVIDGSFQPLGAGVSGRFSLGVYTTSDEWEVEVHGLDHTAGSGINTMPLKRR